MLALEDKAALDSAIRGAGFSNVAKRHLLGLLASKPSTTTRARQRARQDFISWPSFGTPSLWQEIARCPMMALELIATHVNSLGLINPDKSTQKSLAAHVCVSQKWETALFRSVPRTPITASRR